MSKQRNLVTIAAVASGALPVKNRKNKETAHEVATENFWITLQMDITKTQYASRVAAKMKYRLAASRLRRKIVTTGRFVEASNRDQLIKEAGYDYKTALARFQESEAKEQADAAASEEQAIAAERAYQNILDYAEEHGYGNRAKTEAESAESAQTYLEALHEFAQDNEQRMQESNAEKDERDRIRDALKDLDIEEKYAEREQRAAEREATQEELKEQLIAAAELAWKEAREREKERQASAMQAEMDAAYRASAEAALKKDVRQNGTLQELHEQTELHLKRSRHASGEYQRTKEDVLSLLVDRLTDPGAHTGKDIAGERLSEECLGLHADFEALKNKLRQLRENPMGDEQDLKYDARMFHSNPGLQDASLQPKFDQAEKELQKIAHLPGRLAIPEEAEARLTREIVEMFRTAASVRPGAAEGPVAVGIAYRTDGRGAVHESHDAASVRAIAQVSEVGPGEKEDHAALGTTAVALPLGAEAWKEKTGERDQSPAAIRESLRDVDAILIPGAPNANTSQVASERGVPEDAYFKRPWEAPAPANEKAKDAKKRTENAERARNEHDSRSRYEVALIEQAKNLGIPVLALCAGSWRLLEAYGGEVETLPAAERGMHTAAPTEGARPTAEQTWGVRHDVEIVAGTELDSALGNVPLAPVTTTHWAVAGTEGTGENERLRQGAAARDNSRRVREGDQDAVDRNPADALQVSAWAPAGPHHPRTVEGFESRSGAPVMGLQWHPETHLPGMPGRSAGGQDDPAVPMSERIFAHMGQAALTARNRRRLVAQLRDVQEAMARGSEARPS
ncbi:gamma-glutamyl-gamma-aminobutyrate hydrolase family protein [Streptomyces formicae]|uniref:Gamma-glutamyl-gamma-aminobutyrate hydrolase family protein n=1 Tax=Streptomyces formicae TaxID=1616117 RepID=A0ABY3WK28_9ACTN|nr:gamma-glutamyl-gamma-aminobutyrate hydrolase family protein [Streptomyces formicae]UNM11966.1 gamma-glutamyl-gamma-aminobutyrate hydrolase family protein [Streptomyces formicae]